MGAGSGPVEITSPGRPLPEGVREGFREAGGVRFRYLSGGGGTDVPILFLHGWPTWAEVWLPVARRLGTRHRWVAPDLPGQHRSSILPGTARTIPAYAQALWGFLESLEFPRVAVIGNSMGGTLAVRLARRGPERVAALALLDAAGLTPKLPGRTARLYLPFLLPTFFGSPGPARVRRLLQRAVFRDPQFADEAWVRAMVEDWSPPDRRRSLRRTALALRRPDASVAADLPDLRLPTLIASGRDDVQFPWSVAREAAGQVPGGRFAAIDAAGHFPMVEQPEATARVLAEFLDGLAASS